jgi:hypothetical protein
MDIPRSPETAKPIAPQEQGPVSPEKKEGLPSREVKPAASKAEALKESLPQAPPVAAPPIPAIESKDPYTVRIERVLEDNLVDAYLAMAPRQRAAFKLKGEEAAMTLRAMMESTKIQAKRVLKLIWEWLKMIPGVNRFFLEQEAKIKTDRILALHDEKRKEGVF